MKRKYLTDWRLVVAGLLTLVILGVWVTSVYQLAAGRTIEAKVLSCSARSCEVAWKVGHSHGENSTDNTGQSPGGFMQVTYVPGFGVTNRSSETTVALIVPAFVVIGTVSYLRSRRRSTRLLT